MGAIFDIHTVLIVIAGIVLLGFVGFGILSRLDFQEEATDKWHFMGLVLGAVMRQCKGTNCKITPYMMEQMTSFARKMTPDEALPIGYANFPKGIYSYFKKQPDIDEAIGKLCKLTSFTERRSFVRLLFKLVADNDGISNECWNIVTSFMYKMRLNQANYDYLLRCYTPLRKSADAFSGYTSQQTCGTSGAGSASGAAQQAVPKTRLQPYYQTLGLAITATKEEVQSAYRRLALQHHPDLPKNANRQAECEELMAKLNDAYANIMAGA